MTSFLLSFLEVLSQAGHIITENVIVALIVMVGPILTTIVTALLARRKEKKDGARREDKIDAVKSSVDRLDVATVAASIPPGVHKEVTDGLHERIATLEAANRALTNGG